MVKREQGGCMMVVGRKFLSTLGKIDANRKQRMGTTCKAV
jgi:hypothetical protein